MNFGRRNIQEQEQRLRTGYGRWGKKAGVYALKIILVAAVAAIAVGFSAGIGAFRGILASAPEIGNITVTPRGFSTFVYDTEGNQIAKLVSTDSNRIPVTMDMIPKNLANAFVAIEDARYYEHNGIDLQGIVRAAYIGLTSGDFSEGASTITQQLLKNNVFTGWTSETEFADKIKRKVQEQYLAVQLEKTMSKEDILLNYMNTINLGQNTLGVQAASLRYFGKSVSELTLSECAVIAGITQNPSRYNPITHPDYNNERREKVLRNMLEQGMISQDAFNDAMQDDVYSRIQTVDSETTENTVNSYFVDALTNEVLDDLIDAGYNETQAYTLLYSGGLKIYSTQDPKIQGIADSVFQNEENYPAGTRWLLSYRMTAEKRDGTIENHSSEMFEQHFKGQNAGFTMLFASREAAEEKIEAYKAEVLSAGDEVLSEKISLVPQPQISLTIEDQSTGYVVAMIGGRGQKEASRTLNRATDAVRQPGSTFKVVSTYAPALDSAGFTLATVLNDAPFKYDNGTPVRNWYGEAYRGPTTVRTAIMNSMNIIAVKTLTIITPQLGYDYLLNFGFTTLVDKKEMTVNGRTQVFSDIQQALALGGITNGVKNIELNAAFATIANGGAYIKPKLYTRVMDHDGNVLLENSLPQSRRVIKESTAFLLTSAMEDVVTKGTGTSVNFGTTAIAGKTGTTSDYNDVWFSGYTNYYTATVWAGFDNNAKLSSNEEKRMARDFWRKVMEPIHEELPARSFEVPSDVTTATICSKSGKLPISGLCGATLATEYFAEGTVPTATCDVHYSGAVCAYDGKPATDLCPFRYNGTFELAPTEPSAIQQDEASRITAAGQCQHDAGFFSQPNAAEILAQQSMEIQQRNGVVLDEATIQMIMESAVQSVNAARAQLGIYPGAE